MTFHIQHHVSLSQLNTLALPSTALAYVEINHLDDIRPALDYAEQQHLTVMILSGGSNLLLPEQLNALVLKMNIQGIELTQQDDEFVCLKVGAGQVWHDFVLYTTAQGFYGLQNLALIPGLVGASPVQNIGAYGVEVGEFIEYVDVYDRVEQTFTSLSAQQCQFHYRHSIFKDEPNRYIIVSVQFKLRKVAQLNVQYGDLKQAMGEEFTAENLQRQVIAIRQRKLPDPKAFANVGSFFKNPVVSLAEFQRLQAEYANIPHYPQANGDIKLAAGWLIEQAGWKGKRLGQVGMFERQALVLVNYGGATLADVQATYQAVQADVWQKFAVQLEPEPVLLNAMGEPCSHNVRV